MISKTVFTSMVLITCAVLGMVISLVAFFIFRKISVYNNALGINNTCYLRKELSLVNFRYLSDEERILPNDLEFITAAAGSGSKGK